MLVSMLVSLASAHIGGVHDWPQNYEDPSDIAYWAYEDDWYVSPVRTVEASGERLGIFVQRAIGAEISLDVRFINGETIGEWQSLQNKFSLPTLDLLIKTFDEKQSSIQFRSTDPSAIQGLEWDILTPVYEPKLPEDVTPPPYPTQLSQSLIDLGVVSRAEWGAMQTTCSSLEDNWYRMAIHHVASAQTQNGSVADKLQSIQAWAINATEYCDVPYQYLVGYDGTLLEGRPIGYYSGATGGGQNNGNIAVSFIGCYDEDACMYSFDFFNYETEAMMARAREIIQVLAADNGIAVTTDNIKTHQDWPGNSTACPGDFVIERFDELLSPVPPFYGQVSAVSHEGSIDLALGEEVEVWVDILNTGQRAWSSTTKIAPTPRDVYSPLAHSSWASTVRVQDVSGSVSSNNTYRFSFTLKASEVGIFTQTFGLVEEGFTWFADTPYAGSPGDSEISFTVNVSEGEEAVEPSDEGVNLPPVANAGEDQVPFVGETVYLDGSFSSDPDGDPISFSWTSINSLPFVLEDAGTATPYFVASSVGEFELLLSVGDGATTSLDLVTISVREDAVVDDGKRSGCAVSNGSSTEDLSLLLGGLLLVGLRRKRS